MKLESDKNFGILSRELYMRLGNTDDENVVQEHDNMAGLSISVICIS